jgi:CRP-like cAMP-binding protein
MGVIGPGKIFGDVDAIARRRHVYTVKSKTPGASVYTCDSLTFTKLLSSVDPERVENL